MMNDRQKHRIVYEAKKKSLLADNGCIIWTGAKTNSGYGLTEYTDELTKKRVCLPIHRALYMIHHCAVLDRKQFVCHSCDNPSCININHLWVGSAKDNVQDMLSKNRNAKTKRKHTRVRKFDNATIIAIRNTPGKPAELAAKFNTSAGYIREIKRFKVKTLVM